MLVTNFWVLLGPFVHVLETSSWFCFCGSLFSVLGETPRNGIAGSNGIFTLNVLRNCQKFSSTAAVVKILPTVYLVPISTHLHTHKKRIISHVNHSLFSLGKAMSHFSFDLQFPNDQ